VNNGPTFVHEPALENVTGLPVAPPVAATEKLEPDVALAGACVVTEIDWLAFTALTDSTTCDAAS
jgi:hypothetical protein